MARKVLQFNGNTDSFVNMWTFKWYGGGPVTIEFWSKVGVTRQSTLFSIGNRESPSRFQAHAPWEDGYLYWDYGDINNNGRIGADYSSCLDVWTHVALVSEGKNGGFRGIFLGGRLASDPSVNNSDGPLENILYQLSIGKWGANYHQGQIADFRIWNHARSEAEINANMNRRLTGYEPGLVGYWRFDEDDGTKIWDLTGNDNHCTIRPGVDRVDAANMPQLDDSCLPITVLNFNGINNRITFPETPELVVAKSLSLEAWIRISQSAPTTNGMGIIKKGDTNSPFSLEIGSSNKLCFRTNSGFLIGKVGEGSWESSTGLSPNTWHHVAVTCGIKSGVGVLRLYIDGEETDCNLSDVLGSSPYLVFGKAQAQEPIIIGHNTNSANGRFRGQIAELRIWDELRSRSEILNTMHRQLSGDEAHLVAYYGQYENGNARDLTIHQTCSQIFEAVVSPAPDLRLRASLPIQPALEFDGKNDFLTIPDMQTEDYGNGFTFEILIRLHHTNESVNIMSFQDMAGFGISVVFNHGRQCIEFNVGPKGASQTVSTSGNIINTNSWTHIAAVVDPNGNAYIYTDGNQTGRGAGIPLKSRIHWNDIHFAKSESQSNGTSDFAAAEVRLWNCERSMKEIQAYRRQRLAGTETNLVGYWRLCEGLGTALDICGNRYHGEIIGAAWVDNLPEAASPLTGQQTGPGLVIRDIVVSPQQPTSSQEVTVQAFIENIGSDASPHTVTCMRVDGVDKLIATPSLRPGACYIAAITLPCMQAGNHTVAASPDYTAIPGQHTPGTTKNISVIQSRSGIYHYQDQNLNAFVRLDVDGYHAQNKISIAAQSTPPTYWIALIDEALPGPSGMITYKCTIDYRYNNGTGRNPANWDFDRSLLNLDNFEQLEVDSIPQTGAEPTIAIRFIGSDKAQVGSWPDIPRTSEYFREVELELDYEAEVPYALTHNAHSKYPRHASLAKEKLNVEKIFQRTGIAVNWTAGSGLIDDPGGADSEWTDSELHEAMLSHWSHQAGRDWAMWVFLAHGSHQSGAIGIMFDYHTPHTKYQTYDQFMRNGTALFIEHWPDSHWRLQGIAHEIGHGFNLPHPFNKENAENNWLGLDLQNPNSYSIMNYGSKPDGGEHAYWSNFGFRFDDEELYFLRHAPEQFAIMGGANWMTNSAIMAPQADSGMDGLRLEIRVNKSRPVFEFMEPVAIEIKLKNTGEQPRIIDKAIVRDIKNMIITVSHNGEERLFRDYCHHDFSHTKVTLSPGESVFGRLFISAGSWGWYISHPGAYVINVALPVAEEPGNEGGMLTASLTLEVKAPHAHSRQEQEHYAQDYFVHEVGRILRFQGCRFFDKGNETLNELISRFPTANAAKHAQISLGLPQIEPYKTIDYHGGKPVLKVLTDNFAESGKALKKMLMETGMEVADTLGHINFSYVSERLCRAFQRQGKKKEADSVLGNILKVMDRRCVKLPSLFKKSIQTRLKENL